MKKVLITRKLLKSNEERISKLWEAKLNLNDDIYSRNKLIELSKDCDGILSSILDKIDEETINKLPDSVKIISNFAVGFGNIDIKAARKKKHYCNQYSRCFNRCNSRNSYVIDPRCRKKSF